MSSAPSRRRMASSSTAPATIRSARRGSRPGMVSRCASESATTSLRSRRICFAGTRRLRSSLGTVPSAIAVATVPRLRIVPDVPITRSKPAAVICSQCRSISLRTCLVSFCSSRPDSGSLLTNRSVSRITPILKLFAAWVDVAVPSVISVLPPPMSITTARALPTSTP